ncbi:MAG: hypothetical protein K2X29_12695 [Candidatus Obscuribacterales bacterium]|nr:hypothetical protein [Candidatus Obscuribacterales bacterium]
MRQTTKQLKMLLTSLLVMLFCITTVTTNPVFGAKTNSSKPLETSLTLGGKLVTNLDRVVKVRTKFGTVVCAPRVTAYIFDNEKSVTVFNFDSVSKDDVKMIIDKKQIGIRPAEQFVVSRTAGAKFNDINPGLGIIHKQPQPVDVGAGASGYYAEFSLVSGISKVPMLNRMNSSNKPNEKQTIERILKNAAILQSSAERLLRKRLPAPTGSVAQLIEQGQKLAGQKVLKGMVERFSQRQQQSIDMRVSECRNKGFARAAGLTWVDLLEGEWKERTPQSENRYEVAGVLTCPVDTYVKTELGNIECKKGATVFIVNCENSVSICTLDSPHLDDVNVCIGNNPKLRLAPGRQIVLTKDMDNKFEKTNPAHLIGYRDEKEVGTVEGTKIIRTDFSLTSALMSIQPLRHLLTSPDREQNRIAENIIRNSAILWGLTSSQGIFHPAK